MKRRDNTKRRRRKRACEHLFSQGRFACAHLHLKDAPLHSTRYVFIVAAALLFIEIIHASRLFQEAVRFCKNVSKVPTLTSGLSITDGEYCYHADIVFYFLCKLLSIFLFQKFWFVFFSKRPIMTEKNIISYR